MSVSASGFLASLQSEGVAFYTGVADSLLGPLNRQLDNLSGGAVHVPAANEGSAVALAAGNFLATGQVGMVYLQNSGLGNAVNPLLSLADPGVYSIPMLLVVGWRGEPGRTDEPQHTTQGRLTLPLLELCGIRHWVLDGDSESSATTVTEALAHARAHSTPVAVVVPKGAIVGESGGTERPGSEKPTRREVLEALLDTLPRGTVFVATTGYTGRELAQLRVDRSEGDDLDLLVVGSMGHAASISLGIALGAPHRTVCCIDGDGSVAMHMGSLSAVARVGPTNLLHVVVNNGVHESVGGQPTCVDGADLAGVAGALGYSYAVRCSSIDELRDTLIRPALGPRLIEVLARPGAPESLIRPEALADRKMRFMAAIGRS